MAVLPIKQSDNSKLQTGIDQKSRAKIAEILSESLANTYTLQLKTQFYHWNVTGPHFIALHTMLGTQYDELALAVDEVAERIRALGYFSPGTFRDFLELSAIKEDKSLPSSWEIMIKNLAAAHEEVAHQLRDQISKIQELGDEGTADLIIGRVQAHEKTAWMLRSHLT